MTTDATADFDPLENRSEIVYLFDAEQCNPNGDPLADDRPRIDPVTRECMVTDVRIKRYIRDQLEADNHGVFIRAAETEGGSRMTRDDLILEAFDGVTGVDDLEDLHDRFNGQTVEDVFLDTMTDVRYFGATLSFSGLDEDQDISEEEESLYDLVTDELTPHLIGPVQFAHARSLHSVELSEHTQQLAPVVQGKTGKETGTFATDYRIKYGLFAMDGVVNEQAAADTRLSQTDVNRLDALVWRAMKNQTLTRSKYGQEPRLYVRVEYETDEFHVGDLRQRITLDDDRSKPHDELTTIQDVVVDVADFLTALEDHAEQIETVHIAVGRGLTLSNGDDTFDVNELPEPITECGVETQPVDVYEDAKETAAPARQTIDDYTEE